MIISQIKRSYSKTINTQSFGSKEESWIKIESELVANLESHDDPKQVSDMLYSMVREDVLREQSTIVSKINKKSDQAPITGGWMGGNGKELPQEVQLIKL